MLKKIAVLCLLLCVLFYTVVEAAEPDKRYKLFYKGEGFTCYFDTTSIKHVPSDNAIDFWKNPSQIYNDDGYIEVWVRHQFSEDEVQINHTLYPEKLSYILIHTRINLKKVHIPVRQSRSSGE